MKRRLYLFLVAVFLLPAASWSQTVDEIKVREETIIQGMAQVQAYDGQSAWQINPFGGRRDPERMSADDTKQLILDSDLEGFLVNYKEKGHKAELVGHDSVEGTDCYKIKVTLKDGDVRYYYLDADSYLEIKIETQSTVRGAITSKSMASISPSRSKPAKPTVPPISTSA